MRNVYIAVGFQQVEELILEGHCKRLTMGE